MNVTFFKALAALIPTAPLIVGAGIVFSKAKSLASALQLMGATALVIVVLAHVCEALSIFPWMHWGSEGSAGHYLDATSAVLGLTLFPAGYVLDAISRREPQNSSRAVPANRP